ncbi:MAG: hypothetical protein K0S33_3440 [Bacteroidetes bacterium]|jgi:ligand-binding sensor domain-containing protein|nr:hypothetical protein [Bacteroidota bacterium]
MACRLFSHAQGFGSLVEQSLDLKNSFTITQYSTKHGLPQSQVIDIFSKKSGELILSTANGIVLFNGSEFKELDSDVKYKKFIYTHLYWDEKNELLIGRGEQSKPHVIYPYYKSLGNYLAYYTKDDSIFCVAPDGNIFAAGIPGFHFKQVVSTGLNLPKCVLYTKKGLLIGNLEGLYRYDPISAKCIKLLNGQFEKIKVDPNTDQIYALSTADLWLIGDTISKVFSINNPAIDNRCLDLEFVEDYAVFVATTQGLYEISDGYTDHYDKQTMPSVYLYSLYYNKSEDCLFVGTGEKGLLKLQFKNCYSYAARQGFSRTSSPNSIIQTKNGEVLLAESNGILLRMGIDTIYPLTVEMGSYASLTEIDGILYAGTWGAGLKLLKGKKLMDSLQMPELPDNSVHSVFRDSRGNIWVGTGYGIARGTSAAGIRTVFEKEIKAQVITFYELRNKQICIGTNDGVFIVDKQDRIVKHISAAMGLEGKQVRSFLEDEEGKLWIGTYDGGLYCFHKGRLTNINKIKNARLHRDVFCLAQDGYGYLFITSNHGLWRIKKTDLDSFYYRKLNYLVPFYYGEEAGILNTEFNGGFQNNFLRTKGGHFYFPALQGAVALIPEESTFRKLVPTIDEIIINDTLKTIKSTVFQRETYSLQFSFSCVNYSNKYNVYYQYKLDGAQAAGWSQLQKNATINFRMLPPGKYTFSVRAIDAFNDRDPATANYSFEILPYFYETLWFKIAFVIIISLLVFLITFIRIKAVRKKQVEKEKAKRRIAELELNVLLAQMNPHFIFNSLNSLKYFLNTEDIKRADEFIDNFSFLLRKVMIYSDEKFISIADEIAMLQAYIGLESIRMNNRFSYTIEADEDIGAKLIPTFIIQPFVENAIKHGFATSEEYCNLHITFRHSNNIICCIIDDDGIGRKKAGEMKADFLTHESKGISNVLERIAIKKESYGKEISIEIVDKKDYTGKARGTMVVINIEEINDTYNYS